MNEALRDLFAFERPLWKSGAVVAGIDEVGRGALAGPLMVGVVSLREEREMPLGLDDSKRLTPRQRERLVPAIAAWCDERAVGASSAQEIDEFGLSKALQLAALRALEQLRTPPTNVLLDGASNFLRPRDEFLSLVPTASITAQVTTIVRGDSRSALIAAASIVAKVERDAFMRELAARVDPYGWFSNKGYGSKQHLAALSEHGASDQHRVTWHLPIKSSET